VIRHVGQTSGTAYETPIGALPTNGGFVIALPYGTRSDWLKNVLAKGSATIVAEGETYEVDHPTLVPTADVMSQLPAASNAPSGSSRSGNASSSSGPTCQPSDPSAGIRVLGPVRVHHRVVRKVGVGAVVAVVGVGLFALALFVLPWISQGGEEATLADIGRSLDDVDDLDGPGSWKVEYLQDYADQLAVRVVIMLVVAVTFSTLVAPRSRVLQAMAGSVAAWAALPDVPMILITFGLLGLLVTVLDRDGTWGPKAAAALVTLGVGATHGMALHLALDEPTPAPDAAPGVWIGLAGLAAVLVGILIEPGRAGRRA